MYAVAIAVFQCSCRSTFVDKSSPQVWSSGCCSPVLMSFGFCEEVVATVRSIGCCFPVLHVAITVFQCSCRSAFVKNSSPHVAVAVFQRSSRSTFVEKSSPHVAVAVLQCSCRSAFVEKSSPRVCFRLAGLDQGAEAMRRNCSGWELARLLIGDLPPRASDFCICCLFFSYPPAPMILFQRINSTPARDLVA